MTDKHIDESRQRTQSYSSQRTGSCEWVACHTCFLQCTDGCTICGKLCVEGVFAVFHNANGKTKTLRTVGAKWSWLQSSKFGANAQPFYVILDNDGHPLTGSRAYDEDINAYIDFLKKGLDKY